MATQANKERFNLYNYTVMEKGKIYYFCVIEIWSEENNYDIIQHGNGLIGADFVVLVNNDSETISFVAVGYNDEVGFLYECVYSDL